MGNLISLYCLSQPRCILKRASVRQHVNNFACTGLWLRQKGLSLWDHWDVVHLSALWGSNEWVWLLTKTQDYLLYSCVRWPWYKTVNLQFLFYLKHFHIAASIKLFQTHTKRRKVKMLITKILIWTIRFERKKWAFSLMCFWEGCGGGGWEVTQC